MHPLRSAAARALLAPLLALTAGSPPAAEELVLRGELLDLAWPDAGAPPVGAAGVELAVEVRDPRGPRSLRVTTDAAGRFELALEERGARPLRVVASAPESDTHRGVQVARTLEEDEGGLVPLRLERPAHGALEGSVRDVRGRPLAGARLLAGEGELLAQSDAAGRFRVDAFRGAELRVELDGFGATLELEPEPREAGGWHPFELALAPAGSLSLRIVTADGRGVPELELELRPLDPAAPPLERWDGKRAWRWTDAEGRARFEGVWAGTPLELGVWSQDGEEWRRSRRVGMAIVAASHPDGRPLELEPGAALELELRLGQPLFVRGRVLDPRGQPLDRRCYAHVTEVDPPTDRLSPSSDRRARVDDDGRFELRLFAEPGLGRLLVTVGSRLDPRHGALALAVADPSAAQGGVLELDLTGADELELRGRLVGLGATAQDFSVRAVPAGLSRLQAEAHFARERPVEPYSDGAFVIGDLPWGRYDVLVQELTGCIGSSAVRFEGLLAGAAEVPLELAREQDVRVRVRALAPAGEVGSMVVLATRVFPVVARPPERGPLAATHHFADPDPWPPEVPPSPRITTVESPAAILVHRTFQAGSGAYELPPTASGWYSLGVYALDVEGHPYAPVATGPIGLGPGFHEVTLELRRTGDLAGRVVGGSRQSLFAELRDARDRRVTLRRSLLSFTTSVAVRRDGSFLLREAPLGEHRLWIGTEEELEAGRFRRELFVEVREDGEELVVELAREAQGD